MADDTQNGNGHAGTARAVLHLEFDMTAGHLKMTGEVPNFDTALDMLGRATRHYEMQARAAIMQEMAKAQMEAARVQGILNGGRVRQ